MARMLTILVAIVGFGATIWNTINVEKKGEVLEETDAIVSTMEQDIETRELNYRLAVQEFNFSTLHAADAYDLDGNHKLLAASVAPGTTMLTKKDDGSQGAAPKLSILDRAKKKLDIRKKSKMAKPPAGAPEAAARARPQRQSRTSLFSRLTKGDEPGGESGAAPRGGRPPAKKPKITTRLRTAMAPVRDRFIAVRPHVLTPETRHKVAMIRGFQIENLSRWQQYMHVAATGEPMTEEAAEEWEGLLADALVQTKVPAVQKFVKTCQDTIEEWDANHDEGIVALSEETDKRAALEKQISRGKSIYMGLMLIVLVLVTLKDVFSKDNN